MLSLQMNEPQQSPCDCCGGTTVTLTRYVSRDNQAFAVYFARYSTSHPGRGIDVLVSVGGWGTNDLSNRVSIALEMRVGDHRPAVMVVDAANSPWASKRILGRMLDRVSALSHPMIGDVFAIVDCMVIQDSLLREQLEQLEDT